jgi:hypothetical protein
MYSIAADSTAWGTALPLATSGCHAGTDAVPGEPFCRRCEDRDPEGGEDQTQLKAETPRDEKVKEAADAIARLVRS